MPNEHEYAEIEDVVAKEETDRSLLCEVDGKDVWVPKFAIHKDSDVSEPGHSGTLTVRQDIAEEKSLV